MSYPNGSYGSSDTSSGFRSFVSESEIAERRQRRQEEWLKTRTEDQPLEAPEEVYDSRTLYDRLKEQQIKKQEEFEESKKLKHLIKGLDNEELSFLEMVDNNKIQLETQIWKEESSAIDEYKRAVAHLNSEEQEKRLQEFKNDILLKNKDKKMASNSVFANDSNTKTTKKSSQSALLANVIKKRTNSESNETNVSKKVRIESSETKDDNKEKNQISSEPSKSVRPTIECIGVLPGLGLYASDSSDSENSSNSEYEREDLSNFKLIVRHKRVCTQETKSQTVQSAE